jgi:hypothetical protein
MAMSEDAPPDELKRIAGRMDGFKHAVQTEF